MGFLRTLEWIFFVYFLTHIPISLFIDSSAIVPKDLAKQIYPQVAQDLTAWFIKEYKDPMMADPPAWFNSFVYCEMFLQFPFFFVATYAFWKGGCKWVRIPAIVYSSHVITTLIPILAHIFAEDFTNSKVPGPQNMQEKLTLTSFYMPYLILPLMILFTMLFHPAYQSSNQKLKVK